MDLFKICFYKLVHKCTFLYTLSLSCFLRVCILHGLHMVWEFIFGLSTTLCENLLTTMKFFGWIIIFIFIFLLLVLLFTAKSLPLHCVVESVHSLQASLNIDSRSPFKRRPTIETDSYVIIAASTQWSDIVITALQKLGYSNDVANTARGECLKFFLFFDYWRYLRKNIGK